MRTRNDVAIIVPSEQSVKGIDQILDRQLALDADLSTFAEAGRFISGCPSIARGGIAGWAVAGPASVGAATRASPGGFGFVGKGAEVVLSGSGWTSKMGSFGKSCRSALRRSNSSTARR